MRAVTAVTVAALALSAGAFFAGSIAPSHSQQATAPAVDCDRPRNAADTAFCREVLNRRQRLLPPGGEKPSFDCAQAKTAAARLICADGELARLDGELGIAFQKRKAQTSARDQSQFVAEQLAWIRDRNARCELIGKNTAAVEVLASSKPCMVSAIQERIAILGSPRAIVQPRSDYGQRAPDPAQAHTSTAPTQSNPPKETASNVKGITTLDYAAVASLPCTKFLNAHGTPQFSSLSDPLIETIGARGDGLGSGANIIDFVATECRVHEEITIGQAVENLFDQQRHNRLPRIPIGGATSQPEVHASWEAFGRWIHHQGPRPHFPPITPPEEQTLVASEKTETAKAPTPSLNFSRPLYTGSDRAILCPIAILFDVRAEYAPAAIWNAFDTIFGDRIAAAHKVGCEAVREGLPVYNVQTLDGKTLGPEQRGIVTLSLTQGGLADLFTVADSINLRN